MASEGKSKVISQDSSSGAREAWPKVAIIILNWNNYEDTKECLESVENITYPNYKVFVVDNGSTDGSGERLAGDFPYFKFIWNEKNLGFSAGNNMGIKQALRSKADYVMLLNNDTIVDPGMLMPLVERMDADRGMGITAPKIYSHSSIEQNNVLWFAGGKLRLFYGKTRMVGYGERDTGQYDDIKDTSWASGCAMLIRASVFSKVGFLNPDYFNSLEDVDFSINVRKAGYKIIFVPESQLWHKEARSSGSLDSPLYIYFQVRNRLLFMRKNGEAIYWFFFVPHFCVSLLWRSVQLLINKRGFRSISAIPWGIWDFVKGKFGPGSMKRFTLD